MKSNLPPRMRHKFKLRNPKKECETQAEDEIELMADNLLKLQREITEEFDNNTSNEILFNYEGDNYSREQFEEHEVEEHEYEETYTNSPRECEQEVSEEYNQPINNEEKYVEKKSNITELLSKSYQEYLSENNFSSNYEEKINELLDTEDEIMLIGNAIALFEMVYFFKEILTKDVLTEIQFKAFQSVIFFEENIRTKNEESNGISNIEYEDSIQKELMRTSYSELIAICGIPSEEIVNYYLHQIISNPESFEQSFKVLINMGTIGLETLIRVINQDFEELSEKVLRKLSQTDLIVSKIIVPQIYSELISVSSTTKNKNTALFLLSKIGEIAHSSELMQILLSMFKNNSIDKKLLISAISSTEKEKGEKVLINLLQQPALNEEIAVFVIKCLSTSNAIKRKMKLKVEICEYSVTDLLQINKLYFYEGEIKSVLCENLSHDTLLVNSRMLVSMVEKFVHDVESQEKVSDLPISSPQYLTTFLLSEIISTEEKEELPNLEVISIFLTLLEKKKEKENVKTAIIEAFGNISLPENSFEVIEKLISYLFSNNPSILSITCLTLAKLKFIPSTKVALRFGELLRHNFWKVRISACEAVGSLLREPVDFVLDMLIKCLNDGSINRELICQTLLKIHPICEEILIEILKSSKDAKIQEIILCSFNEKQILFSENLLKILETIFEFSTNKKKEIRYICLGVVNSLRKLAVENEIELSNFKDKRVVPFYYNFLSDPCSEIRDMALNFILELGSYAELFLIEGMTKGRVNCKIECAKGLGMRGVQNFRALLLGMRDISEKVRRQCSQSILENFEIQHIINEHQEQESQCISLVYNIKDLIERNENLQSDIKIFLSELMARLSHKITNFKFEEMNFDEDEEIQKEINEFRQSMKLRKEVQESLSTNIDQENYDLENIDPNLIIQTKMITNQEKTFKTPTNLINSTQNKESNTKKSLPQKRYYFKLNQPIEN